MKRLISNEDIASMCLELSLLLHAGVSTGDALALLSEEGNRKGVLKAMAEQVDSGSALSAALRESKAFPIYVCGLVEVGERTGRTEEALSALSRYYEDRVRLNRRVRSALLYPAVMLALTTVQADTRLADASARAVTDYYAADCRAQEILARLRAGEIPEGVEIAGGVASCALPISDTQELQIEVRLDRLRSAVETDGYTILRWQAVPAGEWESDDSIDVWDGTVF